MQQINVTMVGVLVLGLVFGCQSSGKQVQPTAPFVPYQPPQKLNSTPSANAAAVPAKAAPAVASTDSPPTIVMPQVPGGAVSGIQAPTIPSVQLPQVNPETLAPSLQSSNILPATPPSPAIPPEISGPIQPPVAGNVPESNTLK